MTKNNKKYKHLLSFSFILFILIMFVINIFKGEKEFSEEENRNLSKKPELTFNSFINGDYTEKFESYISDQLPGRRLFVNAKFKIDMLLGKSEVNGVFIGKENQLMEDFHESSNEQTDDKVLAINEFKKLHENANVSFMLIPTSAEILKEKLPRNAPVDSELEFINYIQGILNSNIKFISPYNAFYENRDQYLYYRTDHHWTTKGAYIAYVEFCKTAGIEPKNEEEFNIQLVANDFYGSLTSKIGQRSGEGDNINVYIPKENSEIAVNYVSEQRRSSSLYNSASLDEKDKYQVFTSGNHSHINIKSLGDPKKKLLLIKDSYANSFLPFLTAHYGEIDVIDLRYYMDDVNKLMEEKGITDVLFLYNVNTFNSDNSILNIIPN